MINLARTLLSLILTILSFMLLLSSLSLGSSVSAQTPVEKTPAEKKPLTKTGEGEESKLSEAALLKAQQRAFAVSLVVSLADEARSYRDLALRARVLARAADTLWDHDSDSARAQFRRAWEAAERADAEERATTPSKNAGPVLVISLKHIGGHDLRTEVLTLAARRDRTLGEEFLAKLTEDAKREAADAKSESSTPNDSFSASPEASKRLLLARRLLDEDQVDRAVEFAAPALNQVNEQTISFLSALRAKRPDAADQWFVALLARVELDPSADANTVSGLSSYAFTPGFYVTFDADGSVRWAPAEGPITAPSLPATVRNRFFQVGGNILLRPLLPPDQDFTSAGRNGKYMVIKRLLPLFDQYAPDTAASLHSQLTDLAGESLKSPVTDENSLLTQGIQPEKSPGNILDRMQERLDHAKTSFERDRIYEDVAVAIAGQGDARAQDLADKIDNSVWRARVREYVDLSLAQFAIRKGDVASLVKLATKGELSHTQRAWAYAQAARLLMKSDRSRSLDLLEDALAEARRVDADDPNRASMLIGVANQLLTADRVRAWEIMGEAVKAANAYEEFSGEEVGLNLGMVTQSGLKLIEIGGSDFSLAGVVRLLAKEDLTRANDLAKSFKSDAPRAVATLAVANAVFEKSETRPGTRF